MDTFDYQRSNLPSRLPAQRGASLPAHGHSAGASELQIPSALSVRSVLRASRRYWWLILALWTVGVSGLGAAIYLRVRPQYHALSLLKVDPNVLELYGMSSPVGGASYMQTYVELIRSPSVFSRAVNDEQVSQLPRIKSSADPIQELAKVIQVGIRPNTTLIEVSMVSTSAKEAAVIVNAVVDAFLQANRSWSGKSAEAQIKMLTTHHDSLKAEGQRIVDELKALAARGAKAGEARVVVKDKADGTDASRSAPVESNLDVEAYRQMYRSSMEAQVELYFAEARLIDAERAAAESERLALAGGPKGKVDPQIELRVNSELEIQNLIAKHTEAYNKFSALKKKAVNGMGDPGVAQAAQRSDQVFAALGKAREQVRRRIEAEVMASGGGAIDPAKEVNKIRAEVRQLTLKRDALESKLKTLKLESNKQMTGEVEARILEDQRKFVDSNVNLIRSKLDALNMERTNEERIHQIDEAREEGSPFSDKRKMYLAAMPFGVLGLVLALAILLEIRSGRVADPEFLSARLPHEVFAIAPLPTARMALGGNGERSEQRLARFVQSLDHLRVALCEGGTNGEGRCVMITSATGGEGKTTLSAHLAARCANAGTATLLIDADLRRGSLGRLLDVPNGHGLGDVLAGQVELDGGLITTQAGGFHFLSAGTPGIDPTRVLRSTRLAELIGQLRQMYDLIIIDTPPVLPVADALILGRWADGAVMAARYDASRLPLVERANRQIAAAGIPVLGVVVNGVRGQDQAYGSYAYNYAYPGTRDSMDGGATAS